MGKESWIFYFCSSFLSIFISYELLSPATPSTKKLVKGGMEWHFYQMTFMGKDTWQKRRKHFFQKKKLKRNGEKKPRYVSSQY